MAHEGRPDQFVEDLEPADLEPAARAGAAPAIKWLIVLVVVAAGLCGWKLMAPQSIWRDDVDAGLAASQASGKPMLLYFTADWCPPCRQLKGGLLKEPEVRSYLTENYVLVKVDLTRRSGPGAMRAALAGVEGIPTMVLYDADGQETERFTGGEIFQWLGGAW